MTRFLKCILSLTILYFTLLNTSTANAQASFQGLGDLPGGSFYSEAWAVSDDGAVVGTSYSTNGTEAFRWKNGVMVGLGALPGGTFYSYASGISGDGEVVVGLSNSANGYETFRWKNGVMVGLGALPGELLESYAFGVSGDGSVVVGLSRGTNINTFEAFIWNEEHGMRSLQDMLTGDYGLDLTGWTLQEADSISNDGNTIVGFGTNPNGDGEAWIATIPEPTTISLLALCGLRLLQRRHKCECL